MISLILPNHNEPKLKELQELLPYLPFNCEVVIASDPDGEGKGKALREGLKSATGDTIVFLDADLDIKPRMLLRMLPFLDDYDVVVGCKSIEPLSLSRKLLTVLSRLYIRLMFGVTCDTQTGIKVFKRHCIQEWETDGFGYDIELLAKISRLRYKIVEVPIEAMITRRMAWKSIWRTFKESVRIWRKLHS